jgi:hypothetical protein
MSIPVCAVPLFRVDSPIMRPRRRSAGEASTRSESSEARERSVVFPNSFSMVSGWEQLTQGLRRVSVLECSQNSRHRVPSVQLKPPKIPSGFHMLGYRNYRHDFPRNLFSTIFPYLTLPVFLAWQLFQKKWFSIRGGLILSESEKVHFPRFDTAA